MKTRFFAARIWSCMVWAFILAPVSVVQADTAPKPSMNFDFQYAVTGISIVTAQLFECEDASCARKQAFDEGYFQCTPAACIAYGFIFSPYYQLSVQFTDYARESNVFTKTGYNARYLVAVGANALDVRENFSPLGFFNPLLLLLLPVALILTIVVETLVAIFFFRLTHIAGKLRWIMGVNILTLPLLWVGMWTIPADIGWIVVIGEAAVVGIEGLLLGWLGRHAHLSFGRAMWLSVIMNVGSLLAGILVVLSLPMPEWVKAAAGVGVLIGYIVLDRATSDKSRRTDPV